MTKLIATTVLALTATFATIGPAAAAPDTQSDKAPAVKVTHETDNLFDIEYWGLKHQRRADSKIVAQAGTGEILRIDPRIAAQSGSGSI